MKFFIFTCGEGLGHTGRSISLGRELLSAGHIVHFGAYGFSKELIESSGYEVSFIPQELRLEGKAGSFDLEASIKKTMENISAKDIRSVFSLIRKINPDVVVSDGYYLAILAAKSKKIRTCMIVNQSNMEEFFANKGQVVRLLGRFVRNFYHYIYRKVDIIVVPDFPKPHTVCVRNLAFPADVVGKVKFSGPLVRKRYGEVLAKDLSRPQVLCTVGGFGYRKKILENIMGAARMDESIKYTFITGPAIGKDDLHEVPVNVNICTFIADPFPYYKASDLVISAGGHGTLMETLSFGLPLFSFPDKGHNEQENNAQVVEDMEYGRKLDYSVSSEEILSMIREVVYKGRFMENTEKLRQQAEVFYGPAFVRELLENSNEE
ncbi:glycosyltransferase 28 domain-containing protein [Methanolobus psychrophilus R15]|nr:glycosyltransferase 28 domain-containing protein [Methanolobus psychrophilus R15]